MATRTDEPMSQGALRVNDRFEKLPGHLVRRSSQERGQNSDDRSMEAKHGAKAREVGSTAHVRIRWDVGPKAVRGLPRNHVGGHVQKPPPRSQTR